MNSNSNNQSMISNQLHFTDLPINAFEFQIQTSSKGNKAYEILKNINLNSSNNALKIDAKVASNLSRLTSSIVNANEIIQANQKKLLQLEEQVKNKQGNFNTQSNALKSLTEEIQTVLNSEDLNKLRLMVSNSMPSNNIDQNQNQTNPNIVKFIEVTKTDPQTANIFLTRSNGDLQTAIADYYANGDKIQVNKQNSVIGHTTQPDFEMIKRTPNLCLIKANLYVNGQWATY